jgi:membrane fusion protein, copper/silver efflux system
MNAKYFRKIDMSARQLLFACAIIVALISCSRSTDQKTTGQSPDTAAPVVEYYTCPMHPSVRSDHPGACPVCGMALVKKTAESKSPLTNTAALRSITLSPSQRLTANVATSRVVVRSINREISAAGILDIAEPQRATVTSRFQGRIEKLYVNFTGERVERGQPLFDLYSPELISAEQDLILSMSHADSLQTLDSGQPELVDAIRERLRFHFGMTPDQIREIEASRTVRPTISFFSPISGTVVSKEIQEGQYVDEGLTLYQLADLKNIWAYLDVYESSIRAISIGDRVRIIPEAYQEMSITGRVTFIDAVVNPQSRTIRVRAEVPNPNGLLKPQMFVKAVIRVPSPALPVVPLSAVLFTGTRSIVWVEVSPGTYEPRSVVTGPASEEFITITDGLRAGETVVTSGGFLIDSESQLQHPSSDTSAPTMSGENTAENNGHPALYQGGDLRILVKGEYIPDDITVRKGEKVRLAFYRDEDSDCTNEVVFESLNIRRHLPARKTTIVEFTATDTGEIRFACGMGMIHGRIHVR